MPAKKRAAPPPHKDPPRAWQRMLSGRRLDLLDPSPLDIEIEDIAQGLSRVARWNGQTTGDHPFTVAQHSLVVADLCRALEPKLPVRWELAALLHDASEYVIGDMISPFKTALGLDYKAFEHRLEAAVHIRFGLPADLPETVSKLIKRADRACAYHEAVQIAGFGQAEARRLFTPPRKLLDLTIEPAAPAATKDKFLARFARLYRDSGR